MPVLCVVVLLVQLGGETHEWTNTQGKTIKAEFVSATNETVTISMQGRTYVLKLTRLAPQSRALAARLKAQKLKVQKPGASVVVDLGQLEKRPGITYFEGVPFTGVAIKKYNNGQKALESNYKDGKPHGLQSVWYENGQKSSEFTVKDGKPHGLMTSWYENGQKKSENPWKDGYKDGLDTWWFENGQKRLEHTYKDGELISEKRWDEDGNPE